MTDTTETLLRDTLRSVAEQAEATSDWDRLVGDLERRPTPGRGSSSTIRGRLFMAAAALVLVAGGTYAVTQLDDGNQVEVAAGIDYVLPGETVMSRDPLIVAAAPGPEPRFDTSGLGRELVWQTGTLVPPETLAAIETAKSPSRDGAAITKAVVLGSVANEQFTVVIIDGPNTTGLSGQSETSNLRTRYVFHSTGATGRGDLASAASLDFIEMSPSAQAGRIDGPAVDVPSGWVVWDHLPSAASVATFADDDSEMWIRVRSGVAVFPAEFSRNEIFKVEVLDADGNQLGEYSEDVDFIIDPNPAVLEIGDVFQPMVEPDVEGNPVILNGSGITVLVYGAGWCPPCEAVATDALPALAALGDDVTVYSIAAPEEQGGPAAPWPDGADWPFVRLAPEEGSPLLGISGFYPQTVVLGEDNEVIGSFVGFDDYAERLADSGAGE